MANIETKLETNIYCIEITTTQHCNFRCTYCFENNTEINCSKNLEQDFDTLIKRIDEVLESEWFNETFDSLELCFWGGEPTLNYKMIKKIVERYGDHPKTNFFMYSNGAFPKRILHFIKSLENKKHENPKIKKWRFQISYDGNPVHDLCRKTVAGHPTSLKVIDSIREIRQEGYEVVAKGTCPVEYVRFLTDCWLDVFKLFIYHGIAGYALTIDYHGGMTDQQLKEVEKELIKIAKLERAFHKKHGKFFSNIFSENKNFCSSGKNMVAIDVDGKAYFCHGAMYNDCDEMQYTSIYDDNFLNEIKKKYEEIPIPKETDECADCVSTMCLRCNVMKYIYSKKETLNERFNDWTSQPDQCKYYKMVGMITRALFGVIKEDQQDGLRM